MFSFIFFFFSFVVHFVYIFRVLSNPLYFFLTWFWSCSWFGIVFLIFTSSMSYTVFIIRITVIFNMIKMRIILSIVIVVIISFIMKTLLYFLPNFLFPNFFWSLGNLGCILGMVIHFNILIYISKYLSSFFLRILFFFLLMWLSFDVILLLTFFALHREVQKRYYVDINIQNRQLWKLKVT